MKFIGPALTKVVLAALLAAAFLPQAGRAQSSASPVSVKFAAAGLGNVNALPLVYAISAGFIKDQGLKLEIFAFQSGGEIVRAVAAGNIDFAPLSLEGIVTARAAKADIKAFVKMNALSGQVVLVSTKLKNKVKTFADMKGLNLKVGVSGIGGGTHRLMQAGLKKAGVPESDVVFVSVGTGATAIAAFKSGQIDVLSTADPAVTVAVNDGLGTIIWDGRAEKDNIELYGVPYPVLTLGAAKSTLEAKPQVARALASAIDHAVRDINNKSVEQITETILPEYRGNDEKLYKQMVQASKEMFGKNGTFDDASVSVVIKTLSGFEKRVADANIKPGDVYTNEFVKK
jgi:NitT/TauT family transport system substrate-binding protein